MPSQLVFICDVVLNMLFISDWEAIRRRKQQLIDKMNKARIIIVNHTTIEYVRKLQCTIKEQTNIRSHTEATT